MSRGNWAWVWQSLMFCFKRDFFTLSMIHVECHSYFSVLVTSTFH
jgi:hypothetical protein